MRIVSLIPSISETLVECEAQVVGRSRFCIHPQPAIGRIPAVGGTKRVDWTAMAGLKPDLVILDKEENTLEMAQTCPYPYIALHITSIEEVATEFRRLAARIGNPRLMQVAGRWQTLSERTPRPGSIGSLPGMLEWWRRPTTQTRIEYLIWRDPWMAIGRGTFIHAVLTHLGMAPHLIPHAEKYPQIELDLDPDQTVLLFSSEPFPFRRFRDELLELGFSCGLIDGECYSWYGIRSLRFLEANNA